MLAQGTEEGGNGDLSLGRVEGYLTSTLSCTLESWGEGEWRWGGFYTSSTPLYLQPKLNGIVSELPLHP